MMMAVAGCQPESPRAVTEEVDPRVAGLVREYQTAADDGLRQQVLRELGTMNSPGAINGLVSLLQGETDEDRQVTIVEQIGDLEGERVVEALIKAIGSRYPAAVRLAAIDALIFLDDPRAIPPLEHLADDPNREIREAAVEAVDWLQTPRLSADTLKKSNTPSGP